MRLAWFNRIAMLGVMLGMSSFVAALIYVQSIESSPKIDGSPKIESPPKIKGLPLKPTVTVPWCSSTRNLDRRFCYQMAQEYERKGRIRDAAQWYANAAELLGRPGSAKGLKLLDDYTAFLDKYGEKGAGDAIKKIADQDRKEIIAWELKYAKEQQQEAKAATGR